MTSAKSDAELQRTGETVGPLHGIPVLVKDCVETSEIETTFGSAAIEGYTPAEDAVTVRKLRDAGAVILAKTTLPDFATSWFSYSSVSEETKNPFDLGRDPGGSSAGTGAAVAANLATVGIGTDCGGSIRLPASWQRCTNVKQPLEPPSPRPRRLGQPSWPRSSRRPAAIAAAEELRALEADLRSAGPIRAWKLARTRRKAANVA